MEGCDNPRHLLGDLLCAEHRRQRLATVPSIYPMCATEGCPRRARARTAGALCKPCRAALGDTAVLCVTDGCDGIRYERGLCHVCVTEGRVGLAPRARGSRSEYCAVDGCNLRRNSKNGPLCNKHRLNRDACLTRGCATPAVREGHCEKHREGSRMCRMARCGAERHRGQLCLEHYEKQNPPECKRPDCDNRTGGSAELYCRRHDVGIDFAAGDWFDWAAVEQMWWGRHDPERMPTVPELDALFDRAERAGVGPRALANRAGVDENRLNAWRQMLGRIEREGADIAAEVAA